MTSDKEIQDVYIAVLGVTGAGKSSFIATCTGKSVKIGNNLESCKPFPQSLPISTQICDD